MNAASLYAKSNSLQRLATENIYREFAHALQWQEDGCDSILDIGCGTGDVTIDVIVPLLPSNFSRLVGCDISDTMIGHARKHSVHPKVIYDRLDVCGNVDTFIAEYGQFDHALSSFCLHWARNQHVAMTNIHKLLKPNGDCLLMFLTSSNVYTVWDEMSKCSEWSPFMEDVDQFTSPYYHSVCPSDELSVMLQAIGFRDIAITTRELTHTFNNYEEFANFVESINPFVNRIPAGKQQSYLDDTTTRIIAKNKEAKASGMEYEKYTVVIVQARK